MGVSGVRSAADVSSIEAGPQSGRMYTYVLYRFVTETQIAAPRLAHGAKPRRVVTCHMRLRHEPYKLRRRHQQAAHPAQQIEHDTCMRCGPACGARRTTIMAAPLVPLLDSRCGHHGDRQQQMVVRGEYPATSLDTKQQTIECNARAGSLARSRHLWRVRHGRHRTKVGRGDNIGAKRGVAT